MILYWVALILTIFVLFISLNILNILHISSHRPHTKKEKQIHVCDHRSRSPYFKNVSLNIY